jgi:electron transfer flavoprotein alpha subunit
LDEADIVVGVGMGVVPDGLPLLREFAGYLSAPLCTTRDVVDAGWLPRHLQVGLTGRSIAPKLYVAVGIRGAFEHVVGFRRAGLVVAINRNPRALIFRHADFGIVGDYRTAIPLLKAALEEARVEHGR